MRQLLLLATIVISTSYPALGDVNKFYSKYESFGRVFFDENKNGLKEDSETGIGNVVIRDDKGNQAISQPDGTFSLYTDRKENFIKIRIDLNTLPAGSILTTPPEHYINLDSSQLSNLEFGMYYPLEETFFGKPHHEKYEYYFNIPYKIKQKFTLKEDGLYFNDFLWVQFQDLENRQEFALKYNQITLDFDDYNMKDYLRYLDLNSHLIRRINLLVPETKDPKIDLISRELRIKTIKSKVDKKKIFFRKTNRSVEDGTMLARIELIKKDLSSDACRIRILGKSKSVGYGKSFEFHSNPMKESRGSIKCGDTTYKFIIPKFHINESVKGLNKISKFVYFKNSEFLQYDFITSEKTEVFFEEVAIPNKRFLIDMEDIEAQFLFLIRGPDGYKYEVPISVGIPDILEQAGKPTRPKQNLRFFESKYLKESRDHRLFFKFTGKDIYSVTINGHTYKGHETEHIGFNFTGSRNDEFNFIKVEYKTASGEKEKFKYQFPVLYDPQYFFQVSYGTYNFDRDSTGVFGVNSSAENVRYADIQMRYFPERWWGLGISYAWDVDKILVNSLATSDKINTRHHDIKIDLLRRFYKNNSEWDTTRYTLFTGFGFKSFDPGTQADKFDIPEDIFGPHIGGEALFKEVFNSHHIDMATQGHFIFAINEPTNYAFQLSQEVRFNLNSLGKMLGITPYFNHFYRYGQNLQKLSFVIGLHLKIDNADIANSNRGEVRETQYAINAGINFQY